MTLATEQDNAELRANQLLLLGIKIWNKRDRKTPPHAIYCGRPGLLGNPFEVGKHGNRNECCDMFEAWLDTGDWRHIRNVDCPAATEQRRQWILFHLFELKGKDLECWCWPLRCHCLVLAVRANRQG
jgi:hypothetical protein